MESFKPNLEIKDTKSKGKGVYSKILIPAQTIIFELAGKVIQRDELSKYSPSDVALFFQIGADIFLSKSGDLDDYMNHSCNPNCGLKIVGHRALLVSLYQINPGDEITWDYSTTSNDTNDSWQMKCGCEDYNCRKVISGFNYLSTEEKNKYIKLGVVPSYVSKI